MNLATSSYLHPCRKFVHASPGIAGHHATVLIQLYNISREMGSTMIAYTAAVQATAR